jgi:hypothetical protein
MRRLGPSRKIQRKMWKNVGIRYFLRLNRVSVFFFPTQARWPIFRAYGAEPDLKGAILCGWIGKEKRSRLQPLLIIIAIPGYHRMERERP